MPRSTVGQVALGVLLVFLWSFAYGVCFVLPHPYVLPWLTMSLVAVVWIHLLPGPEPRSRFRAALRLRPLGGAAPWVAWAMLPMMTIAVTGEILYGQRIGDLSGLPEEFARLAVSPAGWMGLALIGVAIAPLVEELAFRGLIQRALVRRWGMWPGILLTSVLFALAHFGLRDAYSPLYGGIVLGYAVERSRSVWAGVALHAANNAVLLAVYYRFGSVEPLLRLAQDSGTYALIPGVAAVSVGLLLFLGWSVRPNRGGFGRGPAAVATAA